MFLLVAAVFASEPAKSAVDQERDWTSSFGIPLRWYNDDVGKR